MAEPGAHPRHRHIEGWFRHDGAVARWSGAFLRRWLAGGHPGARPPAGRTHRIGKKPRGINQVRHHKPENASFFRLILYNQEKLHERFDEN
jgi:hypothetical protein